MEVVPRYAEDRGSFSIRLGLGKAADIALECVADLEGAGADYLTD
jgi:hypothetical protein